MRLVTRFKPPQRMQSHVELRRRITTAQRKRRSLCLEPLEGRAVLSAISLADLSQQFAVPAINSLATVTSSTPTGYTPSQIAQAYGFSGITFSNGSIKGDGTGQTIAIVDAYNDPNIVNDLHVFDQTFGLADPPKFSVVNQNGGSSLPRTDSGWSEEIALDVQWAHAMAPGANILLVEANSASLSDLLSAVNYARNAAGVSVISMSWGSGEFFSETQYDQYFTTPSGHTPITFIASAGDSGAQAIWPAISSNVMSVGGTSLTLSGSNYVSESAWSGSGGGYSQYETEPSYQRSAQTSGRRSSPDVSYDASPGTGFAVYDSVSVNGQSGWFRIGGTSAGAPQWASLVAIADQGLTLAGKSTLGNAQSLIYSLSSSDFHDVSSGSNGYAAKAGYDLVTGRGTPIASAVVRDLVAGTTSSSSSSGSSSSGSSSNGSSSSGSSSGGTTSTPTQGTRTYYEWVYWNHRWWLVVVTVPAATDGSSFDAGMDSVETATVDVNMSAPVPAQPAATDMNGGSSAASTATSQASTTATLMVSVTSSSATGGPLAIAAAPGAGVPELDIPSITPDQGLPGTDRSPSESSDDPESATAEGTTIAQSLRERGPLVEAALDACFGDHSWIAPLEGAVAVMSDTLTVSRQWNLTAMAVALAVAAGCRAEARDDTHISQRIRHGWRQLVGQV